jgi:hypothetical protein
VRLAALFTTVQMALVCQFHIGGALGGVGLVWAFDFLLAGGLSLVAARVAVFGFWWLCRRRLRW